MKIFNINGYYYLKHSFRKNKKVITKTKYIGKVIPDNIEIIKDQFLHKCLNESLFTQFSIIKKSYNKEWKNYPESIKKKVLIDISIKFTYNTNAIEGSTITLDETEDIIKRRLSPNKSIDDVEETINHSKVFFKALNEKKELSTSIILRWHKDLFSQTKPDIAGKVRDYLVRVGSYRAPDWQDLMKLLKEYFRWYNKNKKLLQPIEFAARAHYKFEKIHPFGDGNGRIGRLIIAYILYKFKYPILITEYKKRKSYYNALSKPEDKFVQYFFRRYLSSFKEYIKK